MPCQPPKPRAEDEELLQVFKKCVEELEKPETRKYLLDIPTKYQLEQTNFADLSSFQMDIRIAPLKAAITCQKFEYIHLAANWKTHAEKIIQGSNDLMKLEDFTDFSNVSSIVSALSKTMSELAESIPEAKEFSNEKTKNENAEKTKELRRYARNGELIISEPDYEGSNMERIETLLVNMQSTVTTEFSAIPNSTSFDTRKSFVSIVCPSLEGKTQLAFTLRRIKPIYFCLSEFACRSNQKIHRNFDPQLSELAQCARDDLSKIAKQLNTQVSRDMDLGPDLLISLSSTVPLWTIGYLMELVNCKAPYKRNETWMEYFARRGDFKFYPARIEDIPEGYFSEYCLYLDDFYTRDWTIYIRNLARAIGIKTICTGRSTFVIDNVVNERRRPEERSVWSIVAGKLNPPSLAVLNTNHDLENSIKSIKFAALGDVSGLYKRKVSVLEQNNAICCFLNDFMKNQLKYLQPGVAIEIADTLKENIMFLQSKNAINLGEMLNSITRQLVVKLEERSCMKIVGYTFFSQAGLILSETYAKDQTVSVLSEEDVTEKEIATYEYACNFGEEDTKKCEPFFNQRCNARFHFYYLSNPHVPENLLFLTFAPEVGTASRSLLTFNYENELVTWNYKYTHFEANNILTFLACLYIRLCSTVTEAFNNALKDHSFKKLVFNLHPEVGCYGSNPEITISESAVFNLTSDFLDKALIPFLYSIDRSIPIFDKLSDPTNGFYAKPYKTTGDSKQFDGRFEFLFDGQVNYADVICKYQKEEMPITILKNILTDTLNSNDTILCLINCKKISDNPTISTQCFKYCKKHRINVYCVNSSQYGKYKIDPLFGETESLFTEPRLVCIVFESQKF